MTDILNTGGIDAAVATIASAGANAVKANDRTIQVTATWNGTEVMFPYAFDGAGRAVLLADAVQAAKAEHARLHPDRAGSYVMHDLESLLAWAKRFAGADSAAFVRTPDEDDDGRVVIIVDELAAGTEGARRSLRAGFALQLHERLKGWMSYDGTPLDIEAFSDFANRASDELTGSDLITMISNVEVRQEQNWSRTVSEDGKIKLVAEDTKSTSKVPRTFSFAVPVFAHDDTANVMTFTARLVVKVDRGKPKFTYELVDFDQRLSEAMKQIVAEVAPVVPNVYMGLPPA